MYKNFFNLHSAPFKLTPDISCFFAEGNRKAILEALIYTIDNGDGISKVIGEVGSGKTLLSRLLAQSLPANVETLYLINPRISADKILYAIAIEMNLKVDFSEDKVRLLRLLHNRLLELHQHNKQTVLLIDEAQAIPLETLEEIRMLSNLETGDHKLLQIVLFGQPELDQNLKRHEVRQIKERIIHNFYLPRLDAAEVGRYLFFRLQKAGFQGTFPFSTMAVRLITLNSGGFLRRVNILADKCLMTCFSQQSKKVNCSMVLRVLFENNSSIKYAFTSLAFAISVGIGSYFILIEQDLNLNSLPPPSAGPIKQQSQFPISTHLKTKPDELSPPITLAKSQQGHDTSIKTIPFDGSTVYVIQLLSLVLNNSQNVHSAIAEMIPTKFLDKVYFYNIKNENKYIVFLADFVNYQEANQLMQTLPKSLLKNQPYIFKTNKTLNKYQNLKH